MDTVSGHARMSHGGSIHGFSAYLSRFPAERLTVIVLGNNTDTSATKVARDLAALAFGETVALPTPRPFDTLWTTIQTKGAAAAATQYRTLRAKDATDKALGEDMLNSLGYDLIANGRLPDALAMFTLAAETFPDSANAHDSLAEAYRKNGQRALSITHYEKSLALDPKNANAERMLAELRAEAQAGGK